MDVPAIYVTASAETTVSAAAEQCPLNPPTTELQSARIVIDEREILETSSSPTVDTACQWDFPDDEAQPIPLAETVSNSEFELDLPTLGEFVAPESADESANRNGHCPRANLSACPPRKAESPNLLPALESMPRAFTTRSVPARFGLVAMGMFVGTAVCGGLWLADQKLATKTRTEQQVAQWQAELKRSEETTLRQIEQVRERAALAENAARTAATAEQQAAQLQAELKRSQESTLVQLGQLREQAQRAEESARAATEKTTTITLQLQTQLRASEAKLAAAEATIQKLRADTAPSLQQVSHSVLKPVPNQPVRVELTAHGHYMRGLRAFEEKDYLLAEEEFLAAVQKDDADARYHYLLGVSQWTQSKRKSAAEHFRRGAKLEKDNRPSHVFIELALEKAPAKALAELNRYRP